MTGTYRNPDGGPASGFYTPKKKVTRAGVAAIGTYGQSFATFLMEHENLKQSCVV
jgi:hypothetical protein